MTTYPVNKELDVIINLGNGFYYCKCESIIQVAGGTNANANLVGIYVKPGYKIYMSILWIENKEKCSDPFFHSNIIQDCSGFGYNGTVTSTGINTDCNIQGNGFFILYFK